MQSKLNGVRSWLLVGLTAGLVAVPLYATSDSVALSKEELRTAFASTTATPDRQRTVKIGPRDTLWSIARTHRPNSSVTIKQAMLAIRDANPKAFPSGNINEMEIGNPIFIPSTQAMTRLSAMEAEQEVRRQNQAWVASRTAPAPVTKKPPVKPEVPSVADQPKPAVPETKPEVRDLTLVAPNTNEVAKADEANKVSAAQQQRINQLQNDLAKSEENLQIAEREKDDLAERISNMQQQVSTLQQLIQLKDQQLTDMEKQLILGQTEPSINPVIVPNAPVISKTPAPDNLASQIKNQPVLYTALGGSVLLLLGLLFALISTRKKLNAANKASTAAPVAPVDSADSADSVDPASPVMDQVDLTTVEANEAVEINKPSEAAELTNDLDAAALDTNFDLDSLEDELSDFEKEPKIQPMQSPVERDALQEAETFIAYGRLEQAAGFLQTALVNEPDREDLRLKLLEVLVELNDEETFRQQQQQLVENQASTSALERAKELASFFGAANVAASASDQSIADDFNELDLDDLDSDEMNLDDMHLNDTNLDDMNLDDMNLDDMNLDDVDLSAMDEVNLDNLNLDDDLSDVDSMQEPSLDLDDDLDDLEAELDQFIASKQPVPPSLDESAEDDSFDLEEFDPADAMSLDLESDLDLELDLDLEKPLDDNELTDQNDAVTNFEPVDYNSDANDFMQALDSLDLNSEPEPAAANESKDIYNTQSIDEELAALNENLAELKAFSENSPESDTEDLSDLDDLADLTDLDDLGGFSGLNDLGDLGNVELSSFDNDLTTQLDLATAYIEMGDQEGAREILEKVIEQGDVDSRATAQQMLEVLSD